MLSGNAPLLNGNAPMLNGNAPLLLLLSYCFLDVNGNAPMDRQASNESVMSSAGTSNTVLSNSANNGFHPLSEYQPRYEHTVEPLWKRQECLTKVAKFGPFPYNILYKSCLFYPSWQATSFERPPSWVAFIEGFHCISDSKYNSWLPYYPYL